MIQAAVGMGKGLAIGIIGINLENHRRMKAGMPLNIQLEKITPPGTRMTNLVVHYADTYVQVVDDMAQGGVPVTDTLRQEAKAMDDRIKKEKGNARI